VDLAGWGRDRAVGYLARLVIADSNAASFRVHDLHLHSGLGNIANLLWDAGLRRGDGRLLAVMSYATPLASALLLTGLGLQAYSVRLTIGAIIIAVAGLLSRSEQR
jgi:hypothetical protein